MSTSLASALEAVTAQCSVRPLKVTVRPGRILPVTSLPVRDPNRALAFFLF